MKIVMSTLSAALMLGAGLSQAAPFVNHYDAMLSGTPDSDNSIELRGYAARQSLPADFVPSIAHLYAGTPDDDGALIDRNYIQKQSLPLDFVPSVDLLYADTPDADGTVQVRANGKACPLSAAKKGIC